MVFIQLIQRHKGWICFISMSNHRYCLSQIEQIIMNIFYSHEVVGRGSETQLHVG